MKESHWFCRDTMLQALRFVIQGAGAKVDAVIRKNIISLLLSMLGHDEVWLQVDGAGGLFCGWHLRFALEKLGTLADWSAVIVIPDICIILYGLPTFGCESNKAGSIDIETLLV